MLRRENSFKITYKEKIDSSGGRLSEAGPLTEGGAYYSPVLTPRGGYLLPLWPGGGRLFRGGARRLLDLLELRRLSVEGRCSFICTTT